MKKERGLHIFHIVRKQRNNVRMGRTKVRREQMKEGWKEERMEGREEERMKGWKTERKEGRN